MSKELTPLEAFEILKQDIGACYKEELYIVETELKAQEEDFNIIETALKEKEQQDNVLKILKEVIEFAKMLPHIEPNKDSGFYIMSAVGINIQRDIENKERELLRQWVLETCFPKEIKALKIIKEKEVNVFIFLHSGDLETYNDMVEDNRKLTQEEYELLKRCCYEI